MTPNTNDLFSQKKKLDTICTALILSLGKQSMHGYVPRAETLILVNQMALTIVNQFWLWTFAAESIIVQPLTKMHHNSPGFNLQHRKVCWKLQCVGHPKQCMWQSLHAEFICVGLKGMGIATVNTTQYIPFSGLHPASGRALSLNDRTIKAYSTVNIPHYLSAHWLILGIHQDTRLHTWSICLVLCFDSKICTCGQPSFIWPKLAYKNTVSIAFNLFLKILYEINFNWISFSVYETHKELLFLFS